MNRRGFTLIELIVVIALLSVIAAIAVPKYSDMRELSLIKTDLYNSKSIIELARLEVAKYGEIDGIRISDLTESSDTPSIEVTPSKFKFLENPLQTQNTASLDSSRNYVLKYNVTTKKFYVDDKGAMWPVIEGSTYYKCDWKGGYKYIDCTEEEYENVYKDGYE